MIHRGTTVIFMETINSAVDYALDVIKNPRCKVFKSKDDYIDSVFTKGLAPVSHYQSVF